MDTYYFQYLHNVTRLTLRGEAGFPIDSRASHRSKMIMNSKYVPKLKVLILEHFVLYVELVELLAAHSKTLEVC